MPKLSKHLYHSVVCLLWLGCRAPTVTPSAPLTVAPPTETCSVLREKNQSHLLLLRAFREESEKKFGPDGKLDATLRALDFCTETPSGAWALSLQALWRESSDVGVVGRWVISHLSRDGRHAEVAPALPDGQAGEIAATADNFLDVIGNAHLRIEPPQLYDYDHDGEPEIIVQLTGHIHEGGDWRRGRVWTFHDGVVALYPPAANINVRDVQDVDHDGRPDLLTVGPFADTAESPGSPYELTGPRLVAHARPDGRFAMDDEVARAAAQKVCPELPKNLVVKLRDLSLGEVIDCQATATNVACSRLWGATPVALRARIEREYPRTEAANLSCDKDALLRLASRAPVPLQLPRTESPVK